MRSFDAQRNERATSTYNLGISSSTSTEASSHDHPKLAHALPPSIPSDPSDSSGPSDRSPQSSESSTDSREALPATDTRDQAESPSYIGVGHLYDGQPNIETAPELVTDNLNIVVAQHAHKVRRKRVTSFTFLEAEDSASDGSWIIVDHAGHRRKYSSDDSLAPQGEALQTCHAPWLTSQVASASPRPRRKKNAVRRHRRPASGQTRRSKDQELSRQREDSTEAVIITVQDRPDA